MKVTIIILLSAIAYTYVGASLACFTVWLNKRLLGTMDALKGEVSEVVFFIFVWPFMVIFLFPTIIAQSIIKRMEPKD